MLKNILIYTYSFYPKIDGVTIRYKNLITEFVKRNINVHLIISRNIENVPEDFKPILEKCKIIQLDGFQLPYYNEVEVINPSVYIPAYIALKTYCKTNHIDIIHCSLPDIFIFPLFKLSSKLNIPLFGFYHTHSSGIAINNHVFKHLLPMITFMEHIYDFINGMIFPSDEMKKLMPNNPNNFVIPLSIDTNIFYPEHLSREQLLNLNGGNIFKHRKTLLYVGRVSNDKNIMLLMNLMSLLPNNFGLLIIGNGPNEKDIHDYINLYKMNNIYMIGNIDQSQLRKYYSNVDYYISPSVFETMGFATLEAIACGTITIGMNSIGTKNIITNGYNGFLVNNEQEIVTILNSTIDTNTIKKNCIDYVKDKTFSKSVDKLIEFYEQKL